MSYSVKKYEQEEETEPPAGCVLTSGNTATPKPVLKHRLSDVCNLRSAAALGPKKKTITFTVLFSAKPKPKRKIKVEKYVFLLYTMGQAMCEMQKPTPF